MALAITGTGNGTIGNLSVTTETGNILSTESTTTSKVPLFFKVIGSDQTITNGVFTKVQFDGTSGFDTGSYWDATNHRYTPQVAGYYKIEAKIRMTYSTMVQHNIQVYKNGAKLHQTTLVRGQSSPHEANGSLIVQLNGSTDYVEIYNMLVGTGTINIDIATDTPTYVQGYLIAPT